MKNMKHKTTIRKIGNSLGVIIPVGAVDYGLKEGTKVKLYIETNKISITVEEAKEFESRLKSFYEEEDDLCLRPVFFETGEERKSARFEEVEQIVKEGTTGYTAYIFYDHENERYLAFKAGNYDTDSWYGNYVTEFVKEKISKGADPQQYLL